MHPYDEKAWRHIEDRRARVDARRRNVVPERVRAIGSEIAVRGRQGFETLPGSDLQNVIRDATRGITSTIGTAAAATVVQPAVLRRYRRRGHALDRIEQIQDLDLEACDAVFPHGRRVVYMSLALAEGGVAGAMSSATELRTIKGGVARAGAGAVPDRLGLAKVFAADAVATLGGAARIVAWTAALYGYNPNDPAEELFMASVLGVATAGTQATRTAAHREVNHVAGLLARGKSKAVLSETHLARLLTKVWPDLVEDLAHKQMGKAVPALGIAFGAGLNAYLAKRVSDEAYYAYRERRLIDCYGSDSTPAAGEVVDGTLVHDLLENCGDDEGAASSGA